MNPKLFRKLRDWRNLTAKKEALELFRVLPNKAIEEIATFEPTNKEELINIKGIKEKKFQKYGRNILRIVNGEDENEDNINNNAGLFIKEKIYSVSEFLDYLNDKLSGEEIKLKGEITSVEKREKVVYFNLKDKEDGSVLNCLIFRHQYKISGVELEIGNEIIVNGYAEIYKPMGKLSLKVNLIELAGEGALKKEYENLKRKLKEEGLFSSEIKKPLPNLPQTIGLLTSNQGAAIGDFRMNLGNYGFKIKFINSSVEGKQAVFDLIKAVQEFKKMKDLDALVIIRGGGSLESLQAFNNEALVREIASLKTPVICGVGHEKDVSLVALVSDLAVSTPTAAARAMRESWDNAFKKMDYDQKIIISSFEKYISNSRYKIEKISFNIFGKLREIFYRFRKAKDNFLTNFEKIRFVINNEKREIISLNNRIISGHKKAILNAQNKISAFENIIKINNPERQLKLGYSIISLKGKIIKSVKQIKRGDCVELKMSDGKIEAEVKSNL